MFINYVLVGLVLASTPIQSGNQEATSSTRKKVQPKNEWVKFRAATQQEIEVARQAPLNEQGQAALQHRAAVLHQDVLHYQAGLNAGRQNQGNLRPPRARRRLYADQAHDQEAAIVFNPDFDELIQELNQRAPHPRARRILFE